MRGIKKKNKICLYSYTDKVDYIKYLNPSLINLSNNHINDYGIDSCRLTAKTLEDNKLQYFGVGTSEDKTNHIVVDNENKIINIAYITRTSDFTGSKLFADNNFIGGYETNLEEIKLYREKYKEYKIIINIHWGIENIYYPEVEKRNLGYKIIDAGADLIIGHHPHIIQPIEIYKGKYIFYSIGNFYFPEISFEDKKGIVRKLRSEKHQREGIVPIIDTKGKELKITKIILFKRNKKGNKTSIKNILLKKLILEKDYGEKWWNRYYKTHFIIKKLKSVVRNPFLIIKKIIIYIYEETFLGKLLNRVVPEKIDIKNRYKYVFGVYPNLENPKLFSEKIQWLKLNDRTPLHTICADKYKVREYVKEKIGEEYLIPLIFETKNVKDICKKNMPDYPVIIKTNHDSGGGEIIMDKEKANYKQIRKTLKSRLRKNYYWESREWEYKNIDPRIIVEKLLKDESGNNLLNDYKIYYFNGVPAYIQTFI